MIKAIFRKYSWQLFAEFTFCFSLNLKLPGLVITSLIFTPLVCSHYTCHISPILYFAWAVHVLFLVNKSEIENGIKAIKHLSCFQKSLPCRNDFWMHNKRGEPIGLPQEQPDMYPWHLNLPPCPGRAEPAAGPAHIPPALWGSWTICCLWGKELNSASCRENNY